MTAAITAAIFEQIYIVAIFRSYTDFFKHLNIPEKSRENKSWQASSPALRL
jgi:hypothetical protein